jgi:hypothetical protein
MSPAIAIAIATSVRMLWRTTLGAGLVLLVVVAVRA